MQTFTAPPQGHPGRIPPEERGWRIEAIDYLIAHTLGLAQLLHGHLFGYLSDGPPVPPFLDTRRASLLLERFVRLMGRLEHLAEQIHHGVAYVPPVRKPATDPRDQPARRPLLRPGLRDQGPRLRLMLTDIGLPRVEHCVMALRWELLGREIAALLALRDDPRARRLAKSLCRLVGLRADSVLFPLVPERPEDPDAPPGKWTLIHQAIDAALAAESAARLLPAAPEIEDEAAAGSAEPDGPELAGPERDGLGSNGPGLDELAAASAPQRLIEPEPIGPEPSDAEPGDAGPIEPGLIEAAAAPSSSVPSVTNEPGWGIADLVESALDGAGPDGAGPGLLSPARLIATADVPDDAKFPPI